MKEKVSSWVHMLDQQIKRHSIITGGVLLTCLAFVACTLAIQKHGWGWTGFFAVQSKQTTVSTSEGAFISDGSAIIENALGLASASWSARCSSCGSSGGRMVYSTTGGSGKQSVLDNQIWALPHIWGIKLIRKVRGIHSSASGASS